MARKNLLALVFQFLPIFAVAAPVTFVCDYKTFSNQEGHHQVTSKFALTFLVDGDKAHLVGNNGSEPVTAIANDDYVSFIEVTANGNVMTTTILADGKSVHSRNTIMFGDLIPSQYYGTCESR